MHDIITAQAAVWVRLYKGLVCANQDHWYGAYCKHFLVSLWTFLTIQTLRSQTAVRRGAPSNEYQWLAPYRCGTYNRLRHFAHPSPNFAGGGKSAKFVLRFNPSRVWVALIPKTGQHVGNAAETQVIALNTDTDMSPILPLIFTGAKQCEIWPQFSLWRVWLPNGTKIGYLKQTCSVSAWLAYGLPKFSTFLATQL